MVTQVKVLAVLAALCFSPSLIASEVPVAVPIFGADKPVPSNSFAELSVKTEPGDLVSWDVTPDPVKLVGVDGRLFFSGLPGKTYNVTAHLVNHASKRFEKGKAIVSMEGAPGPGPLPPDPPKPPEPPVDPLLSKLKAAFDKETVDERKFVPKLAEFYRDAVTKVDGSPTWHALFDQMVVIAANKGVAGHATQVQDAIRAELIATLPWKGGANQPMTDADKKLAKAEFERIAATLDKLMK